MEDEYIVGIGEVLFDIFENVRKVGGAPANFAYHISQFGFKSKVVSAIGDDDLGKALLEHFDAKSLEYDILKVEPPTGTVNVELDALGIPRYDIKTQVAWDNIPFSAALEEIAKRTKVVSFGSLAQRDEISRQTIYKFLQAMPKGPDVYKMFDINLRQNFYTKEVIETSLTLCNVLKINDEELDIVSKMLGFSEKSLEDRCQFLMERYELKILILTCGSKGSYVFTKNEISYLETPQVTIADTVGAGDSFGAAFIASLLRGKSIEEAHRFAIKVSAYICTQSGAMPALPSAYLQEI